MVPTGEITLVFWHSEKAWDRWPRRTNSSLRHDLGEKILNLDDDQLEIYCQPAGTASREQMIIPAVGTASPLAFQTYPFRFLK